MIKVSATISVFTFIFFYPIPTFSDDTPKSFTSSGKIQIWDIQSFADSPEEDPSLLGRVKLELKESPWRMVSTVKGGLDGTVNQNQKDKHVFKTFDRVYQDNTPFLEIKELYLERFFDSSNIRVGIQRFTWGKLDEYPPMDILNPWDYTQFIRPPLEERKIGVPSVALSLYKEGYTFKTICIPVLVPYRLALPGRRWAFAVGEMSFPSMGLPIEFQMQEPDLPARTFGNSEFGFRLERIGEVEWAVSSFTGYDRRPVFSTNHLRIETLPDKIIIDPGYKPSFHRVAIIGADAAWVTDDLSLRTEVAYVYGRYHNLRTEFWGYPSSTEVQAAVLRNLSQGQTLTEFPLQPIEVQIDTVEYGIGADYRMMEDTLLTVQIQQTALTHKDERLMSKPFETILWGNLRRSFLNARWEVNIGGAWNPEHKGYMARSSVFYTLSDSWKANMRLMTFGGESESLFGQYRKNDQAEVELVYYW